MKERYQEIEEKNEKLREILSAQKDKGKEFLDRYEMSWIYHDAALEGIVYAPQELQAALFPGTVAAEASLMPVILDIRNHKAAVDYVRAEAQNTGKKAPVLTMAQVKQIHDLISGNSPEALAARAAIERREKSEKELAREREKAGYRKDMPLHRTYFHEIAQPAKIQPMLEKLVESTGTSEFKELPAIHQAAFVQHQLIQIFPFTEHSGRVGRLCSNLILLRHNFLPCLIHSKDRQSYYEAFRGPVTAFRSVLLSHLDNSLENAIKYYQEKARRYRAVN